jgi:hypothetical protein
MAPSRVVALAAEPMPIIPALCMKIHRSCERWVVAIHAEHPGPCDVVVLVLDTLDGVGDGALPVDDPGALRGSGGGGGVGVGGIAARPDETLLPAAALAKSLFEALPLVFFSMIEQRG